MTSNSKYITHPNESITHYLEDNFTDPWKPSERILIQHGFARHATLWYRWVPVLRRYYRTPSLPKIIDTIDQLGLQKVHFLGESTSGMIGEALAAIYPERLHSLIICSSPTHLPTRELEMFSCGKASWPDACRELGSRDWAEALRKLPGTMSIQDPGYANWWVDQVAVSSGKGLAGYAKFLSTVDSRLFLKDIKVPMLILAPAHSAATSLEDQRSIQKMVPGVSFVVIDSPGHEIYVERPEECQKAVLEFLGSLVRR